MAKRGRKPSGSSNEPQSSNLAQSIRLGMELQQEQVIAQIPQEILFVYGSLMKGGRFHHPISKLEMLGNQAYLPFTRKTLQKDGQFPSPVPDATSLTIGEAYLLPTDADKYGTMMANLDRIEAVSSGLYARTQLPVIVRTKHADGQQISLDFVLAWVYVAQEIVAEPEQIYDFAPLFAKFKDKP